MKISRSGMVLAGAVMACSGAAFGQETVIDLPFPTFGFFETFFTSGHTELDGYTVVDAEMHLEVNVISGDASFIQYFHSVPVDLDPSTDVIDEFGGLYDITGAGLGWSGSGTFSHTFDVSGLIGGAFVADVLYGGGIFGRFPDIGGGGEIGEVSDNSYFRLTLAPVPAPSSLALLGLGAPVALRRRRK